MPVASTPYRIQPNRSTDALAEVMRVVAAAAFGLTVIAVSVAILALGAMFPGTFVTALFGSTAFTM